jgi:transposase-like protein
LGPRCKEAPSHKATKQEEFESNCSHYIRNLVAKVQKKAQRAKINDINNKE